MLVFATAREDVRERWTALFGGAVALVPVVDWRGLLVAALSAETRLVVVDGQLEGLHPELLAALVGTLPHRPVLRVVEQPREGLVLLPARATAVASLLRRAGAREGRLDAATRNRLRWSGLGPRPLERVSRAAGGGRPVLLVGERGTGKEHIARALAMLAAPGRPWVVVGPDTPWRPEQGTGSVYFEAGHLRADLPARLREARAAGWHAFAGARAEPEGAAGAFVLRLAPLRERPDHFDALLVHALEVGARAMGLPRRRFDRALVARLRAHRWPGNERELDRFVADCLDAVDQPLIREADLPSTLLARLDPAAALAAGELAGFEEIVAARLAPTVASLHAAGGTDLHALVADATDRALIRLALANTRGSRKAAARLLGLARNTLQARIERLLGG